MLAIWCCVIGIMVATGVYMMLERHILRVIFGVTVLSNAVNLSLFLSGNLTEGILPIIQAGKTLPESGYANPLPQALILTAIVIGFGLLIFILTLSYRNMSEFNSADVESFHASRDKHEEHNA